MTDTSYADSFGKRTDRQVAEDLSLMHFCSQDFDFRDGRYEPALAEIDQMLKAEDFDGIADALTGSTVEEWKLALGVALCQRADEEVGVAQEFIKGEVEARNHATLGAIVCSLEILEERFGNDWASHFQRILDTESERAARKLYRGMQITHDKWLIDNGAPPHTSSKREAFRKAWQALFG